MSTTRFVLELSTIWGTTVLDTTRVRERRPAIVAASPGPGVDLVVESACFANPSPIAVFEGELAARVTCPPGARLLVAYSPGAWREATGPVLIEVGAWVLIQGGGVELVVRVVPDDRIALRPGPVDGEFARIAGVSAVVQGFLFSAMLLTPDRNSELWDGLRRRDGHPGPHVVLRPAKKAKAAAKSTVAGTSAGPRRPAPARAQGVPRKTKPATAGDSGLLKLLGSGRASSQIFGGGGLGGLNTALGAITGPGSMDAGPGGLGTRGPGPGGGGPVGIGELRAGGPGSGGIDLGATRPRERVKLTSHCGADCAVDNVDRAEIARVIARHLARFKFCYEKELNANPNLAGKISVGFTIGTDGRVMESTVRESTMDSPVVEACVTEKMRSIAFNPPKGGGIAVVTYPFVFATAGL